MGHPVLSYGMTATTLFGHQVNRHMHAYGTTSEQLALVAVKNWANASRNEHAQRQETLITSLPAGAFRSALPTTSMAVLFLSQSSAENV